MEEKGYIHIYCGDGKGKTSSAIGLAVRAAGRKKKVLIARFLKTDNSGEVPVLLNIPEITVLPCEKNFGFYFQMTQEEKKEAKSYYTSLFFKAVKQATDENFDLLILDEIVAACNYNLVEEQEVLIFLKNRNPKMEIVMTGREPSQPLLAMGDYVSEIKKVRHPFDQGAGARQGIEY